MRDLCKLFFGPRRRRFEAPELQISAVAVDCHPVARGNRGISDPRLSAGVDCEFALSDDAALPHLPRYQRSMSGTSANHRDNAACNGKAGDIGRAGIATHQDHRIAGDRQRAVRRHHLVCLLG